MTDYAVQGTAENVGVDCAAMADGSPIIAVNLYTSDESNQIEIHGYDGPDPRWVTTIETEGLRSFDAPVVWLDEDRGVAWVFAGGNADPITALAFAAAIAL